MFSHAVASWAPISIGALMNFIFGGAAVAWLGPASGTRLVALAGLIAHELSTERIVHSLDVRSPAEREHAGSTI